MKSAGKQDTELTFRKVLGSVSSISECVLCGEVVQTSHVIH